MKKVLTIICVGIFVLFVIFSFKADTNNDKYNFKYEYEIDELKTEIEELEIEVFRLENNNLELENQIEELEREILSKEEYIDELENLVEKNDKDECEKIDIILVDGAKIEN